MKIRPEIMRFAEQMEVVLSDDFKGDWKDYGHEFLFNKIDEEVAENRSHAGKNAGRELNRIIDVANTCMMLWHKLGGMKVDVKRKDKESREFID